ncbi:hypothetical protein DSL72_008311 [Monilinia vaccinii-corymbosi]|uniref:Karyogamy protein n=1 Tax=Monilinia vaccinii-corymbosi TaxID=61207 RepID=A0A8A3PKH1_9HELO|nr:hypothetical protein DSL72_008311 [Monilinia vaccinii-corymbosi]
MTVLKDALSRSDTFLRPRSEYLLSPGRQTDDSTPSSPDKDQERKPRAVRKPSPGLAARLAALGFGKDPDPNSSTTASPPDRIGRIPEDQIRQLDHLHRANSTSSHIHRRGRAWSGSVGLLTPQVTGGSLKETNLREAIAGGDTRVLDGVADLTPSLDRFGNQDMTTNGKLIGMDSQKYRSPEHTNGNGTKTMADIKPAHIERVISPVGAVETPPSPVHVDDVPPPPIAKDTPPDTTSPSETSNDVTSYFNPFGRQRDGSIYTLSRASFASQLAQLTSLQLPDAASLSTKISAIPSSKSASKALMGAAEQIRSWISKASDVVSGLDGEDDVEWAAAGGREGLEDVDNAITRFEKLINIYVSAIESLQERPDITTVPADELQKVVLQVESILEEWEKIRRNLKAVKNSVEIAMEWEELWNTVLGDIGNEVDILARLVFEMEEKRHKSLAAADGDGVDIKELETIVEETPPAKTRLQINSRFGMSSSTAFPLSPNSPVTPIMAQDDSSLLALFARMQPLRASLDFLPMRLSTFHARAETIFPTACEELESRRAGLEKSWKSLERDAESLRRELGEDRWVLVFRGAGRQAQKMYESVERSCAKLKESLDNGVHLNNPATMGKKIESYEAKKMHYGPAIERVLSIIEKGVKDRLTVNGEILRLHSDMQRKWDSLKGQMNELDTALEELQADHRSKQLRDSISSMVSNDRSTIGSFSNDTPGSSPASSVIMTGLSTKLDSTIPARNGKIRSNGRTSLPQAGANKNLSAGQPPRSFSRASPSPIPTRQRSATPTARQPQRSKTPIDNRPRWNTSTNVNDTLTLIGPGFKPLAITTPNSTHSNRSTRSSTSECKIPLRSPLGRGNTASPIIQEPTTPVGKRPASRTVRRDLSTPGPYSQQTLSVNSPSHPRLLISKSSMSNLTSGNRRSSMHPSYSYSSEARASSPVVQRPASSLATGRRTSLLPTPRGRNSEMAGRDSPAPNRGSSTSTTDSKGNARKPWRP